MKMFLVKRKILTAAVCLLLAAGMFYVVNHPAIVGAAAAARQLPIYCVQRDQKVLSISFDAAWGDVRVRQHLVAQWFQRSSRLFPFFTRDYPVVFVLILRVLLSR